MPWAAIFFANTHVKLYLSQMGKKVYVFLTLQRTPRMKQKGPLIVFVSQEKDKRHRLTIRHTSYLYLIIVKKVQRFQSLMCQLLYVLLIPPPLPPLTPRKDNTGETIANCCLDCGIELWLHKTIHFTTGFSWTVPLWYKSQHYNNKHQR